MVRALDASLAAALLLEIVFDEDHATIARLAGRSEGAMRVALHRARRRLSGDDAGVRADVDDAVVETTFAICWQAVEQRDARLLHPLMTTDVRARASTGGAPPIRMAMVLVAGRPVLALRQGRAVLCVLPVGVLPVGGLPACVLPVGTSARRKAGVLARAARPPSEFGHNRVDAEPAVGRSSDSPPPSHAHRTSAMTWSILARDDDGRIGVAIASRFFAVGALCVHTRRAVGAVATQALMNPLFGPAGLQLLQDGRSSDETVEALIEGDEGRAVRQVHVLPIAGRPAAHTGSKCVDWNGHRVFDDFSVAGNMLAGPRVLDATADAFVAAHGRPLAERLIAALAAGDAAGGDKRGRQAAALRIHGDEEYPELDLRVDDHDEPFVELERLHRKSLERFVPFVACLPSRRNGTGLTDRVEIEAHIEHALHARRQRTR